MLLFTLNLPCLSLLECIAVVSTAMIEMLNMTVKLDTMKTTKLVTRSKEPNAHNQNPNTVPNPNPKRTEPIPLYPELYKTKIRNVVPGTTLC